MNRNLRRVALGLAAFALTAVAVNPAFAKDPKSRFYDFSDQLIDGDVKKPSTIWMESRTRAKFEKLLKLKKSFRQAMIDTSKEPILK